MRDEPREQAVQLDVQGLVVHHHGEIVCFSEKCTHKTVLYVSTIAAEANTRDQSQYLHHTQYTPREENLKASACVCKFTAAEKYEKNHRVADGVVSVCETVRGFIVC